MNKLSIFIFSFLVGLFFSLLLFDAYAEPPLKTHIVLSELDNDKKVVKTYVCEQLQLNCGMALCITKEQQISVSGNWRVNVQVLFDKNQTLEEIEEFKTLNKIEQNRLTIIKNNLTKSKP